MDLLKEIRKTIIKIFSSKKTDQNKFSDDYPKYFGNMKDIPEAQKAFIKELID